MEVIVQHWACGEDSLYLNSYIDVAVPQKEDAHEEQPLTHEELLMRSNHLLMRSVLTRSNQFAHEEQPPAHEEHAHGQPPTHEEQPLAHKEHGS